MGNLLAAWQEFVCGKRSRPDVQEFSLCLMDNILALHYDLCAKTYRHGGYHHFRITDPKPRDIHKASIRDRLVHHAVYRILYPFFDRAFSSDSYSCRKDKGSHKAINRFRSFAYQVSQNHTCTAWALQCDIKKFFASINHKILLRILREHIVDQDVIWLLGNIIASFSTQPGIGLPLGNLTSQLLVNIYLNEFDQFVKHKLKIRHYVRYADDFILLVPSRHCCEQLIPPIADFLQAKLCLQLHPGKIHIRTIASGVDFLGWLQFSDHRVLRTVTRKRMCRRLLSNPSLEVAASYRGLLKHGNTYKLQSSQPNLFLSNTLPHLI